jgi:hypothetical protein
VKAYRHGLDQRAILQRDRLRQLYALMGLCNRVLAVAPAIHAHDGAPGRLAGKAGRAVSTTVYGHDGNVVADLHALRSLAQRGDTARVLMSQHRAARHAEDGVLCQVQVAATDSAATDLDHHFTRAWRRVGQRLDGQRLLQFVEDGCAHGV